MSIHDKHIKMVEAVNNAKTEAEHSVANLHLHSWREGVADGGTVLRLMDCDLHYMNQGIDRPMCCGVWLDWKPK